MDRYRAEFWSKDSSVFMMTDHDIPVNRAAYRALRGSRLRTEIYAKDGTGKAELPYTVTENRYQVEELQPQRLPDSSYTYNAVYLTRLLETLTYHYERNPDDPRVAHQITLGADEFGNVTDQVSIAYPRRSKFTDLPEQRKVQAVYTKTDFINTPLSHSFYYIGVPYQTRTYEVTGWDWSPAQGERHFTRSDFEVVLTQPDQFLFYAEKRNNEPPSPQKRLLKWKRTYFRPDDATTALDGIPLRLGEIQSLALPYESYQAALTNDLLQSVFVKVNGDPSLVTPAILSEAGYHQELDVAGYWWVPSGRQTFDPDKFYLPQQSRDPFGNLSTTEYDDYALLVKSATDPVGNTIQAHNDYRVLQPDMLTDPNNNRSAVAYDALGMVVGTAVMGKTSEGDSLVGFRPDLEQNELEHFFGRPRVSRDSIETPPGVSLLAQATTRILYDLSRFQSTQAEHPDDPDKWRPVYAATLARETHVSDLEPANHSKLQVSFSYSDGFGREVQRKIMAEPGPLTEGEPDTDPRWVGSSWTVFNNKGKPVRQYEPFFTDSHDFEFGVKVGVSPILFYDPLERVVATLHPNHSYEKVLFGPWYQETWDVNDTVMLDPRQDQDVTGFFVNQEGAARLVENEYLPSWQALRTDPDYAAAKRQRWPELKVRRVEEQAAEKAIAHADTPTTTYFDTLGRPFLTVADNGPDPDRFGEHLLYATHVELDIEGNQRAVTDAMDRIVMRYDYEMLGNRIHQASMEAGARWMLNDVLGNPLYAWDSRNYEFHTEYDPLRRPLRHYVTGANPDRPNEQLLTERLIYGEQHPEAEQRNLRGQLYLHLEQAGAVSNAAFDFKGNLLHTTRRMATEYKKALDWSAVDMAGVLPTVANMPFDTAALENALASFVDAETYTKRTSFDAMNCPHSVTSPDGSIYYPTFNEANLLDKVAVHLAGATAVTAFVSNIDYNAKGQRTRLAYNAADHAIITEYMYDHDTFRLYRLQTTRSNHPEVDRRVLQDLYYTYDPVGNITHIRDDAQQTIFFKNQRVEPSSDYTYDAMYRLIEATGREHLGQLGCVPNPPTPHSYNDAPRVALLHPGDGKAMGVYQEC